MHPARSPVVPFSTYGVGGRNVEVYRAAPLQPRPEILDRRTLGALSTAPYLGDEAVRQRCAREGGPRLELAVKCVRNVAELDHLRNARRIACGAHDKSAELASG